jgi:TPR repeat protein
MSWFRIVQTVPFILAFAAVFCVDTSFAPGFGVANGRTPSNGTNSLNQSSTIQVYFSALRGDASAIAILRHRASGGDAVAEALLGGYYYSRHNAKAFTWLSKATAQHSAVGSYAATWLGNCYFYGLGTKQNYLAAEKWWRMAAGAGNAFAAFKLGLMYENGTGLSQNLTKALHWFQTAASDRQPNVTKAARIHIQHISLILAEKLIQDGHYSGAFAQLIPSATQGSSAAAYLVGNLYAAGHSPLGVKIQPLPQAQINKLLQTAAAGEKALNELKHYSALGEMHAQYAMAIWCEHSFKLGSMLSWLASAAHWNAGANFMTGDLAAQYRLATLLLSGSYDGLPVPGISQSYGEQNNGVKLLKIAAGRGYLKAMSLLGCLYFGQPRIPNPNFPNRKKAKFWLTQAAAKGDKHAAALLAVMAKGGGPPKWVIER